MRVFGLALAGVATVTIPMVAHALPLGPIPGPAASGIVPGIVQVWGGCGRSPVIGATGEADGFRPIAHRTSMALAGEVPTAARQVRMGVGVAMAEGKDPTAGGVITAMSGSTRVDDMRSPGHLWPRLRHGTLYAIGLWASAATEAHKH